jgi:hypothetical protein
VKSARPPRSAETDELQKEPQPDKGEQNDQANADAGLNAHRLRVR